MNIDWRSVAMQFATRATGIRVIFVNVNEGKSQANNKESKDAVLVHGYEGTAHPRRTLEDVHRGKYSEDTGVDAP